MDAVDAPPPPGRGVGGAMAGALPHAAPVDEISRHLARAATRRVAPAVLLCQPLLAVAAGQNSYKVWPSVRYMKAQRAEALVNHCPADPPTPYPDLMFDTLP